MLELYFSKVAELYRGCFPVDFHEDLRTPFLQKNRELLLCSLKKESANIDHQLFCLSQELLEVKVQILKFLLEDSFRYHFGGFMFKELL